MSNLLPVPDFIGKSDMPGETVGPASSWGNIAGYDWDPPGSTGGLQDGGTPPTEQVEVWSPVVGPAVRRTLPARIPNPAPNTRDAAWAAPCNYTYVDLASQGPGIMPSEALSPLRDDVLAAREVDMDLLVGGGHLRGPEYNSTPVSTVQGPDAAAHPRTGPQATEPFRNPPPRPSVRAPRGAVD